MQLDLTEAIKAVCEKEQKLFKAGAHANAPARNEAEVGSAFSDLWTKLKALGAQVDWSVVLAQLLPILKNLIAGKSIGDIIAWLMPLFGPAIAPTPAGPSVGKP